VTVAEEQTSIVDRKDHLQGEPSRESIRQNPEHLASAEGEEQLGLTVSAGCASVEVTEEDPRIWRGHHGEDNLLRLKDRGVCGPTSSVADVCQSSSDGVCNGGSTLAKDVRCLDDTRGREAQSCCVGSREQTREVVGCPKLCLFRRGEGSTTRSRSFSSFFCKECREHSCNSWSLRGE